MQFPKLNQLVKEYKYTKNNILLEEIFLCLKKLLLKKAKYVYYKQKFFKYKYDIRLYDKVKEEFKTEERVQCFRLCEIKTLELEDIVQELNITILQLFEKYDETKPFENYLLSTLKHWRPSYIQDVNFIKELDYIRSTNLYNTHENKELNPIETLPHTNPKEIIELEDLFENLTEIEKKVINFKKENPRINQSQIAEKLGVTQQMVSLMLKNIKKKCNYDL